MASLRLVETMRTAALKARVGNQFRLGAKVAHYQSKLEAEEEAHGRERARAASAEMAAAKESARASAARRVEEAERRRANAAEERCGELER